MRTTLKGILIGAVLLVLTGQAFAYPPDNAAVLYYRDFMIMEEPSDALGKILAAVRKGEAKPDDQVRQYVERNRRVIKYAVTAADISHCEWGYDLSEGMNLLAPELAKIRNVAYLLAVDTKVLAAKGDYKTALERCITIHKISIHLSDDFLISRLVGNAIGALANECIVEILPQISNDTETLQRLRAQLADVSSRCPSMRVAIGNDTKVFTGNYINRREEIIEGFRGSDISRDDLDKMDKVFRQNDENEFYVRLTEYYQSILSRVQIAYDLPYPQTKQALEDLNKEIENAAKEKPEAVIVGVFFPMINRVVTIDTRDKTEFNAVRAGIEIYLIRAKTGKLPDELPAGLPKNLFSGKDFLYAKTGAGFTLTGQGKDLDKDIIQKYEFKVAK